MLTRDEFVHLVTAAYAATGLKPHRDRFVTDVDGVRYGCAIGALVCAYGRTPSLIDGDWIAEAQRCFNEPYDFFDGVITGYDGYDEPYTASAHFQRGLAYGKAAAAVVFGQGSEQDFSSDASVPAQEQEQEAGELTNPLVMTP